MLEPEKVKLDFEHIYQIDRLGVLREAVKETQRVVYHAEIKALKANGKVALGSELVHQDPPLTEDGLIEARGRISPYLDWNSKFLTILPGHDLAKLVVKDTHKRVFLLFER